MLLIVLLCSLQLSAAGQRVVDDWVDPYDMLNYDVNTQTMRRPREEANYDNVATKRREYTQDSCRAELASCSSQGADLQRQIEEQKKKIRLLSQQPTCNPVFKRFLSRLLKEIQKLGLPSDSSDVLYDAKVRLSRQAVTEIQTLLEGEDSWRTGALDNAISQILVDLKPHDYEAWKWRFEDTFGVELDSLLKMGLCVLVMMAIICTQLWSTVSWFVQFKRLFAICFIVSIIWNWFYLYKIAFAEHQNNIVKMDSVNEKCTGMRKIDWSDSLKEWFRSTWTLQDDPCKRYYEVLMVNPILLVPPTKAISVTITTFITEPLKHFGQGISEFLRALLKDLPVTLQIPVLLTIVLSILVVMYGSVQAAFQHGIMAPLRLHHRRDPPPPELEQPQPQPPPQRIEGPDRLAGGDAPQPAPRPRPEDGRLHRNQVHRRRPDRRRNEPARVAVEMLVHAAYSEDDTDARRRGAGTGEERNVSADSDAENQTEAPGEPAGAGDGGAAAAADAAQAKAKPAQSEAEPLRANEDDPAPRSQPAGRRTSQTDAQDRGGAAVDGTTSVSPTRVETIGVPVQETCPLPAE